ncbi:MAG: hypothetical protein LH679_22990 [Cyanobacteria bacterium CAN_BIN43]|nr:hypothetical protein [Cyanobacteria bacterium CAN_BIN43]
MHSLSAVSQLYILNNSPLLTPATLSIWEGKLPMAQASTFANREVTLML